MLQNKFQSLILQYGRSVGMGQSAERIFDGYPVKVDGVIFSLGYNPSETPDHFSVYCDLGVVHNIDTVEVQGAMLRMNALLYMTHGLCLTISPTKADHAVCSLNLPLADLSVKTFCSTLESLAKISHEWRRDWTANFMRFSTEEAVLHAVANKQKKFDNRSLRKELAEVKLNAAQY